MVHMKTRNPSLKKMAVTALFAAISVVLMSLLRFPFPPAPFLEYDPADIPIFLLTFAYGPLWGLGLTVLVSVVQGMTVSVSSGLIGIVMHIVATGLFVLVAGLIFRGKNKSVPRALIALACGVLAQTAAMVAMNLLLTPIFMGTPVSEVIPMILPVFIPFNLMKAGINAAVTFLLYRRVSLLVGDGKSEAAGTDPAV